MLRDAARAQRRAWNDRTASVLLSQLALQCHRAVCATDYPSALPYQPWSIAIDVGRCRKAGTKVIVYIPPLRNDVKPPYDPNEYLSFKRDVQRLTATFDATFVDEDKLVPGRYWGTKAATRTGGAPEYDFMHYQGSGHRLLANAMLAPVEGALR